MLRKEMPSSPVTPPMSSSSSPTDNNTGATGIEEEIHQQVAPAAAISSSNNEEGAAEGVASTTSRSTAPSVYPASAYSSSRPLNHPENIFDDDERHPIPAAAMTAEKAEYRMNK